MERIILYYSDGGKTKVVAETLAINLNFILFRWRKNKSSCRNTCN